MEEPLAMESIRQVAKEIAPDQVNIVAAVDKSNVDYGNPITIQATVKIKDETPLANVPVRIEGRSTGETNWRLLATDTSNLNGVIEKPLIVGKSTSIRIYSEPTWDRSEGASTEISVSVNRLLSISAPGTARSNEAFTITGQIRPRIGGVYIQAASLVNGTWKELAQPVVTDAQGTFSINLTGQMRGVLTLRLNVAADAQWTQVTSQTFNIIIR
ncbi:unannotated protein [freshwater metagenome]|uniref:Unannotated protein n=1 Tax=freshwater metagenome TaxID=449393 RepID=A0A6J7NHZ7_9ZZZZ